MSEFVKEKWEPQISDDCAYIVANKGKFLIAEVYGIGAEESEKAEARVHLIAAAPATVNHRDKLVAACTIVQDRLGIICADGGSMQDFLNAGSLAEIVEAKAAIEGK